MLTYLPSISLLQVRGARPTQPYVVCLPVFIMHPVQSRLIYALSVVPPTYSVVAPAAFFAVPSAGALY